MTVPLPPGGGRTGAGAGTFDPVHPRVNGATLAKCPQEPDRGAPPTGRVARPLERTSWTS
jgi:hypothetical protein